MERSPLYRVLLFLAITVIAVFLLIPSVGEWFGKENNSFVKAVSPRIPAKINRGVDLAGGEIDEKEIDFDDLFRNKTQALAADLNDFLTEKKYAVNVYPRTTKNELGIDIKFAAPADIKKLIGEITKDNRFSQWLVSPQSSSNTDLRFELDRGMVETTVATVLDQAANELDKRVNKVGVEEISVSRSGSIIEIIYPGKDKTKIAEYRRLVEQTAQLFFRVDDSSYPIGGSAPEYLTRLAAYAKSKGFEVTEGKEIYLQDEFGKGPAPLRKETYITAKTKKELETFIKDLPADFLPPTDHELNIETLRNDQDVSYRTVYLNKNSRLTGEYLADVGVQVTEKEGASVSMVFNATGASMFEKLTESVAGGHIVIVLDNEVKSFPQVKEKISGGNVQITLGKSSQDAKMTEARELVAVLKAGSLPVKLTHRGTTLVGATVGADMAKSARLAMLIGSLAVILFMLIYYRLAGLIANVAMVFNILFLLAIMALLHATLTLPGIAAIVLSIGMAVDANIIIYERIREELRAGKTARGAVEAGFGRAFWTIFDAHVVTLVTGIVLYSFGTGPVKGFAVSLMAGIVCNLFTSVWLSRLFFDLLLRRSNKDTTLSI